MTEEIKKDRHRPGYWKERWQKQKKEGKQPDRHRPGYYREYNLKHPERLARVGIYVGEKTPENTTKNGSNMVSKLTAWLEDREHLWHDDDWCED